jgi:hypothetical protein
MSQFTNASSSGSGGSGTVTNIATTSPVTGGPITGTGTIACPTCGVTGSPLSQFAATTSAQLAGVISDETGTGVVVFNTSPTFVTPALGTPASGNAANLTGLPVAGCVGCVGTNQTNTAGTGMTLDMSAATGATALKIPVIAGATAGADGVIDYDSTGKMTHSRTQGLDGVVNGTVAILDSIGQSATQTAVALTNLAGGAFTVPVAGRYTINQYVFQKTTCSVVGAGTLLSSVAFTDPATGRNTTGFTATIVPGTTLTTSTTQFVTNALPVFLAAGGTVTVTNTYTACGTGTWTFDSHFWLIAQ